MTERIYITLKEEEQKELSRLLDDLRAKEDMVDTLAKTIKVSKSALWDTIHELYPEIEGKEAAYHRDLGKISYKDEVDELAKLSENVERLRLLRKLRKSKKISREAFLDIMEVLNDD